MTTEVKWLDAPENHDYDAAFDYLELHLTTEQAAQGAGQLREASQVSKKAKDILRAANLKVLPADDPHVAHDLKKIRKGEALSPVLIVRAYPAIVADGYHRVCAAYHIEPNTNVACHLL